MTSEFAAQQLIHLFRKNSSKVGERVYTTLRKQTYNFNTPIVLKRDDARLLPFSGVVGAAVH